MKEQWSIDVSGKFIRIYINKTLHILFRQDEFMGVQSWIEATNLFKLEIHLRQGRDLIEKTI